MNIVLDTGEQHHCVYDTLCKNCTNPYFSELQLCVDVFGVRLNDTVTKILSYTS